jgi:hypothetical protein
MKKVMFGFLSACMMLGLASCTKDYTCSCTVDYGSGDSTLTFLYDGVKKSDAEDACAASETVYKNVDAGATCTLD